MVMMLGRPAEAAGKRVANQRMGGHHLTCLVQSAGGDSRSICGYRISAASFVKVLTDNPRPFVLGITRHFFGTPRAKARDLRVILLVPSA